MENMSRLDRLLEATAMPPVQAMELVGPDDISYPQEDPQEEMLNDLLEGVGLLMRAQTLLTFLADPLLCASLTKRERESMRRLNDKIAAHLSVSKALYDEVPL